MEEFEKVVGVSEDRNQYRQNIMTQLGVYALEHPGASGAQGGMDYVQVFPDLMKRIRDFYIDEHSQLMKKVYDAITLFEQVGVTEARPRTGDAADAEKTALAMVENMKKKYGYTDVSAREAFVYLVQKRY
jgi:PrkA serine protein kinase C-terminal domain